MKKVQVSAQVPENKEKGTKALGPVTISVEYGETAAESVKMFGEEPMNSNAFANWRVLLQSGIRNALKAGLDQAAIQAKIGSAKMGVAAVGGRIDPVQAYMASFASATPEKQAEMLETLKEGAAS